LQNFPKTAKTAEDFLFGYERISSIDQKQVARAMEKAIYHRDHGGQQAHHHHLDEDEGDENEKPSNRKEKAKQPEKKEVKVWKVEKEKEKEPEQEPVSLINYGILATNSYDVIDATSGFVGFGAVSYSPNFEDKENDTKFLNTAVNTHQAFTSSPLKAASRGSNPSSFLDGFAHRLPRRQLDWLSHPTSQADKVKRAVEAAQAVYELDGDEDDLIDTLERVYSTLNLGLK